MLALDILSLQAELHARGEVDDRDPWISQLRGSVMSLSSHRRLPLLFALTLRESVPSQSSRPTLAFSLSCVCGSSVSTFLAAGIASGA